MEHELHAQQNAIIIVHTFVFEIAFFMAAQLFNSTAFSIFAYLEQ